MRTTGQEILDDIQIHRKVFREEKICVFRNAQCTDEEHSEIVKLLFEGNNEGSEGVGGIPNLNHKELLESKIHLPPSQGDPDDVAKYLEDRSKNFVENWHTDQPFLAQPPSIISMYMHTFKCENLAPTVFVDLEKAYAECPAELLDQEPFVLHGTGVHPDGEWMKHPVLRTHPVTGNTCLFYTGKETKTFDNYQDTNFENYMSWVKEYLLDKTNWIRHDYSQSTEETGDLLVWDNRNVAHAFPHTGWKPEERIFNKKQYGYETPYYSDTVNIGDR